MNKLLMFISSLFLCLSINATANEKAKEDSSFWKNLDNLLAEDEPEKVKAQYVKPKHSLNADMTKLLAYLKLSNADFKIVEMKDEKGVPFYRINIVSPIIVDGFGMSPNHIDKYEVTFAYTEKYVNVSAALASVIAVHLGGVNKANEYEKVIANLQNKVAKKINSNKSLPEVKASQKYDKREFILTYFPQFAYGVMSITQTNK